MKNAFLIPLLGLVATQVALAQGHLWFDNYVGARVPIYEQDGVTELNGPAYTAGLWFSTVTSVSDPEQLSFSGITQPFRSTPGGEGYFGGGDRVVPGADIGEWIAVQVRARRVADGADFDVARAAPGGHWGMGHIVLVRLASGVGVPTLFGEAGMCSFNLTVNAIPEPSVFALVVLSGLGLMVCRVVGRRR